MNVIKRIRKKVSSPGNRADKVSKGNSDNRDNKEI